MPLAAAETDPPGSHSMRSGNALSGFIEMHDPATVTPSAPVFPGWFRSQCAYAAHPSGTRLPWGLIAPLLGLLFVVVSSLPIELAMDQAALVDAEDNPRDAMALALFLVGPFSLLGLLVLGWTRWIERRPVASIGLASDVGPRRFLRGYGIGLAMACGVVAAIWLSGGYTPGDVAPAFASPRALASMGLLLVCFAIQSSVEEILFRGWMLSVIARKFNPAVAVILSTAVFALLHAVHRQPPVVAAGILLFSTFTCAWALSARNVWGAMGWHSAWNWLLCVGFGVPVTGIDAHLPALLVALQPVGPAWITGGAEGPEGSAFCAILLGAGTLVLLARLRPRAVPSPRATA